MKLQLPKLQDNDKKTKALRPSTADLPKGLEKIEEVLQYQDLSYVPELIRSVVISHYYNDLPAGHFGIDKTRKLVG